jgi:hypothetical protein
MVWASPWRRTVGLHPDGFDHRIGSPAVGHLAHGIGDVVGIVRVDHSIRATRHLHTQHPTHTHPPKTPPPNTPPHPPKPPNHHPPPRRIGNEVYGDETKGRRAPLAWR